MELEQFSWFRLECPCNLQDVQHTDVPFAAFNAANICPVQSGKIGQLFLREARRLPQLADTLAKLFQVFIHQEELKRNDDD